MSENKLIASALASTRLGIFTRIVESQFDGLDLTSSMVYLVDLVHPSALPWLAEQFGVDGYKGYNMCRTDEQRRELIKNAMELHKLTGTIAGIKKACSLVGFTPRSIEENVPITTGGQNVWCAFRLSLSPDDLSTLSSDTLTELKKFIDNYKNARSILTEIYFDIIHEESIFITAESGRDSLLLKGTHNNIGDYSLDYGYDYY